MPTAAIILQPSEPAPATALTDREAQKEAAGRGVILLMLVALLGVVLLTTVTVLLLGKPGKRRAARRHARYIRADDPWAEAGRRAEPSEEGDELIREAAPGENDPNENDPDNDPGRP
ncbi:MAG: hypothetical protein AAFR38_12175 [Planctomycetota bacterium]